MSEMRKKFFPDWAPEREDFPDGIRQLLHDGEPLMRNPSEEWDWMRSLMPGDDYPSLYVPNPYACMMPSALKALMEDPFLSEEEQRLVRQAWQMLQSA